jgi:hypothetical protein
VNLPVHLYTRQNEAAKPHFFGIVFRRSQSTYPLRTTKVSGEGAEHDARGRQCSPKNVTILGLPWLLVLLHIVCPLDKPRYYLVLTTIHRLLVPLFTSIPT